MQIKSNQQDTFTRCVVGLFNKRDSPSEPSQRMRSSEKYRWFWLYTIEHNPPATTRQIPRREGPTKSVKCAVSYTINRDMPNDLLTKSLAQTQIVHPHGLCGLVDIVQLGKVSSTVSLYLHRSRHVHHDLYEFKIRWVVRQDTMQASIDCSTFYLMRVAVEVVSEFACWHIQHDLFTFYSMRGMLQLKSHASPAKMRRTYSKCHGAIAVKPEENICRRNVVWHTHTLRPAPHLVAHFPIIPTSTKRSPAQRRSLSRSLDARAPLASR